MGSNPTPSGIKAGVSGQWSVRLGWAQRTKILMPSNLWMVRSAHIKVTLENGASKQMGLLRQSVAFQRLSVILTSLLGLSNL